MRRTVLAAGARMMSKKVEGADQEGDREILRVCFRWSIGKKMEASLGQTRPRPSPVRSQDFAQQWQILVLSSLATGKIDKKQIAVAL